MSIENIYKGILCGDLESESIGDLVPTIEELIAGESEFALYQKAIGTEKISNASSYKISEFCPLIGYGGAETNPFISDPGEKIPGAFAIIGKRKQLIYSPKAIPLHHMRDAYIWAGGENFYTPSNFSIVVKTFIDNGYGIQLSEDMRDFRKDYRFTTTGAITLEEIFRSKKAK
jgi:hypothetical protein